jgi:hypothetical protein
MRAVAAVLPPEPAPEALEAEVVNPGEPEPEPEPVPEPGEEARR